MTRLVSAAFVLCFAATPVVAQGAVVSSTHSVANPLSVGGFFAQVDPLAGDGQSDGSAASGSADGASGQDGAANQKKRQPNLCGGMDMIFILVFFGIFWFFIIRPQSKKQKEHQTFISALSKGSTVVTQGGIIGRISEFDDTTGAVVLEVDKNTKIKVIRGNIAGPLPAAKKDENKDDKKDDNKDSNDKSS